MSLESTRARRLLGLVGRLQSHAAPRSCHHPHRYTLPCLSVQRSIESHRPLQELCHKRCYHIPGGRAPAPSPFCSQNKCGRSLHPCRRMPPKGQRRGQKPTECWVPTPVLGANPSSAFTSSVIKWIFLNLGVHSQKVGQPTVLSACRTGFGFIGGIFFQVLYKALPNVSYIYIDFIAGLPGAGSASIQGLL